MVALSLLLCGTENTQAERIMLMAMRGAQVELTGQQQRSPKIIVNTNYVIHSRW